MSIEQNNKTEKDLSLLGESKQYFIPSTDIAPENQLLKEYEKLREYEASKEFVIHRQEDEYYDPHPDIQERDDALYCSDNDYPNLYWQ